MEEDEREVRLKGILNFRDLGGLRTAGGRVVKRGRVFRCANPEKADPDDLRKLKAELKIESVINLRVQTEAAEAALRVAWKERGFRYFNAPVRTEAREEWGRGFKEMGAVYCFRLEQPQYYRGLTAALELITRLENRPLMFHCGLGKDRTGVLAALLLSVLEVSEDDIIRDYTLTTRHLPRLLAGLTEQEKSAWPDYSWEAPPEAMATLLTWLKQEYGSAGGYLVSRGLEQPTLERLQNTLLE